jgi:hypothetical protein
LTVRGREKEAQMSRSTVVRIVLAALATALVVLPASASAGRPTKFHDNFTDTFSAVLCGIPVDGVATGVDNFFVYPDGSFKDTASVKITWTNPVNGKSVIVSNKGQVTGTSIVDEAAGTITFVTTFKGLPEQIKTANGSLLLRDAGIAVFTDVFDLATGDPISSDFSIKGPHPDLESDFVLFCEVIVPALS